MRLFRFLMLLCAWPMLASGAGLTVKGNVTASWRNDTLVSPAQDAIVHAGDAVSITVSGQVDINQETRHERHCDVWVFCHNEDVPVHHFMSPDQAAVVFQLRPVGGGDPVASARVGTTTAVLTVTPNSGNFTAEYEIVAVLEGTGSWIDPGHSGGSYDIVMNVDAGSRAQYFSNWLNDTHPDADTATGPGAIADDLRTQGSVVAAALRQYAVSAFPVSKPANKDSQGKLLRAAVDIAPDDVENTLALARYLHAIGLDAQADAAIAAVVAQLQSKGDPVSRRKLGEAYLDMMTAALSEGGGVNPSATQTALSYADSAVQAFQQAQRPDLESKAQFARGRLLRGLRSRESLSAAEAALQEAFNKAPDVVAAETVLGDAAGANSYSLALSDQVSLSSLVDGPRPVDPHITGQLPILWDAIGQRLLVSGSSGLGWLSAHLDSPQAGPAIPLGAMQVGDGAIVRFTDFKSVDYYSKDQVASNLPVGGGNSTTCLGPPPQSFPGIRAVNLSPDGTVVAVLCNTTLRIFQYAAGSISLVLEKPLPAGAQVYPLAGPSSCGAVLITQPQPPQHPNLNLTLLRGSSPFSLVDLPPQFFTLDRVAFAADKVLVATTTNTIHKYRCLDGGDDGEIALPSVPDPPPGQIASASLRPLSPQQLAVVRVWARSVDVIGIPGEAVAHFKPQAEVASFDLQTQLLLPATVGGGSPLILRAHRLGRLTQHPSAGTPSEVDLDIPGSWDAVVPTTDGSHLIVQRPGSPTWVAENKTNPVVSEGPSQQVALDTLESGSGWLAGNLDATSLLQGLVTTDPSGSVTALKLPDVPASYQANLLPALRIAYSQWSRMPGAADFPGIFPNKDLPKLIADPSLLTVTYRVLGAGLSPASIGFAPGLVAFRGTPPSVLPPLSAARGPAAVTVCASAAARPAAGSPALPIGQLLPDQLFLGVESGGTVSFQAVPEPKLMPTPPGMNPHPPLCIFEQLVRGAKPTVFFFGPVGGVLKLQMLAPSGWITTDITRQPATAWSAPDGSFLLLVPDTLVAPDQVSPAYSVLRLKGDGTSSTACALCSGLALQDTFKVVVPSWSAPTPLQTPLLPSAQSRMSVGGPVSMVMSDVKGRVLALPIQAETVVVSLSDGKVLKRVPLGKPLFITEHLLAISSGDGRVGFYTLDSPQ